MRHGECAFRCGGRRMPRLSEKEMDAITNNFYSCFCGIHLSEAEGISFVCSASRNDALKGFGCKYSIYVLVKEDACIVSYAPKYAGFFKELQEAGVIDILTAIHARFAIKKMQLMKFKHERVKEYGNARVLKKADYPLYEEFFQSLSIKSPVRHIKIYLGRVKAVCLHQAQAFDVLRFFIKPPDIFSPAFKKSRSVFKEQVGVHIQGRHQRI